MSAAASPTMSNTMTITSTSTPALNGTYNVGGGLEARGLQAEINAVALNEAFADGSGSLNWPDVNRAVHTFTVAQFKSFIAAVALYQAQWTQFVCGVIATAPTNTATIP